MTTLDDLLSPRHVAVVGASDNPRRIGGRPLAYFKEQGFEGAVYPVNPNREKVQGIDAYPALSNVPGPVDFVLVAVPAAQVVDVMRQAVEKQAKTVMIFSSGFAEAGEEGTRWQEELARIAAASGVRVVGPNCLGAFNAARNFYPTFTNTISYSTPLPGGLAIASQSGAYGSHIYFVARKKGLGMNYWVTTGNESDLHTAEIIRLMAEHDDVHTICAYAESIKDGAVLCDALETARAARKPVIFMKVGRSAVGAQAASSHTASLAGEDKVYDAVLRQCGAYRARTTEEMLDVALACRPRIFPAGRKVGLVTISGGAGVLMADAAADHGLEVAPMPADAQAKLKELVPFASPRNPVDVTAQFFNDLSLVETFTKAMIERGGYDALLGFWTTVAGNPAIAKDVIENLRRAMQGRDRTLFIQSLIASDEIVAEYEGMGFPCFEDPTRAVAALAAACFFGRAFDRGAPERPAVPAAAALPDGKLGERAAKAILRKAGLNVVEDRLVRSSKEAREVVAEMHGPAAMKIASPDILHKTEAGGVALHVTEDVAGQTYNQITANASRYDPDAHIDGVMVIPMVNGGIELILGAKVDPVFGPVVMAGLGGVFTEILEDVVFRRAPIGEDEAREMVGELHGYAMLEGARGQPPVDMRGLTEAISKLSVFAAAHADEIESVEMNPVRAREHDCIALDALIVRRS
ncbi:MAG TPA: acetate--CoA ligase family protein [Paracoccaceae bacterium]|nr:acetate--CoA ligase family protein [Paracoccaceae bacterium]